MKEKKEKRKPVRVFRVGPRCTAIKSEQCLPHDQEDIAGKPELEPPLHDQCDCLVIGFHDGTACPVCRLPLEKTDALGIAIQVKRPNTVDPKKEETVQTTFCSHCLFVIKNIIEQMMAQGVWPQIEALARQHMARPGEIVTPNRKIITPH